MGTPTLDAYTKKHVDLKKAKDYLAHFSATGYQGSTARPHSLGKLNPTINLQYVHCGQNYWSVDEEAPGLSPFLQSVVLRHLGAMVAEAVKDMESDLEKTRVVAEAEYRRLFAEVVGAAV